MKMSVTDSGAFSKISLNGKLDAGSSAEAETSLFDAIAKGNGKLALDLTGLEYVSSAGLRVMLVAAKRIQQRGGKLALYGLNGNVREVFDISGFTAVFKIFQDEAAASGFLQA